MDDLLVGAVDRIVVEELGIGVNVRTTGVPDGADDAHCLSLAGHPVFSK